MGMGNPLDLSWMTHSESIGSDNPTLSEPQLMVKDPEHLDDLG